MKKYLFYCFLVQLCLGFGVPVLAQDSKPICGTEAIYQNDPVLKQELINKTLSLKNARVGVVDPNTIFTLPVVFVVYHLGETVGTGSNLSDAKLNDELAKLNDAFRARGTFAGLNDSKIQFERAKFDANCGSASGIVRVNASSVTGYAANGLGVDDFEMLQSLRALHNWNNRDEYITIELVHQLNGAAGFAGYLNGFLVLEASAYWYGLTAHEMGHCLNLRHTFEGDNGGGQCPPNTNPDTQGDLISDTDPHKTGDRCADYSETSLNVCSGVPFGKLLSNFMSYGFCWDRFTPKQIERMRNSLASFRPQWLASKALTGLTSPPIANAVERCGPGSVTLTAAACSGTYNWYNTPSGGSSLSTSTTYTTPSLTATTDFYVTCTTNTCGESPRQAVTVTIRPAVVSQAACTPTATNGLSSYFGISEFSFASLNRTGGQSSNDIGSGYSDYTCSVASVNLQAGNSYPFTLKSLYNNSVLARIYIDFNNNGSFAEADEWVYNGSSPLATHTGNITIPTSAVTNTGLRMRVMLDPAAITSCSLTGFAQYGSGRAEDFTITITPSTCTPPAAPTVNSVSINSGQTATLTASNCSGSVKWYSANAGGTLLFTGNPYVTGALSASTTYYASCTTNNCESTTRGSGAVTVNCTPPAAPTVNSVSINSGQTATLTASNCSGSVKWYDANTGGTLLFTGNPYVTGALSASTTYYASCTVNNCESTTRGSGTVTVNCTPPAAPTVNSVSINSGQTATLTASNCSGSVKWYDANTGGTLLFTGNPYVTGALSASTTYYASCTVNCESTTRGSGTVTVNCAPPAAPTVNSVSINSGQTATLTASNCSGSVKWYDANTGGTLLFTGNPYVTGALSASTTYYASCTVNNCESTSRGGGAVTVSGGCTPPNAPNMGTYTLSQANTINNNATNACVGGTLKWYDAPTNGNLLATGGSFTTPILYSSTTYYVSCTINGCESSRGAWQIVFNPNPCVATTTWGNTNLNGTTQVSNSISSTSTILSGRSNFFAGKSITLNPGFKTSASTIFRAEIQDCVPTNGLVAFYRFSGNANDESGNLNHGVVTGATLATDRFGNANRAYRFADGNNIRVPNSSSLNLPNTFSFSVWVNMQSTTGRDGNGNIVPYGYHTIFAKNCDNGTLSWGIASQSNGTFVSSVWAGNNGDYPTIPFQLNQWKHLTITYDGTTLRQYENGSLVSTKAVTNSFTQTNASDLYIGKMGCYSYFFNGALDEIRVYNRALNATEVKSIFNYER